MSQDGNKEASENQKELYKQFRASQEKYIYFMLALSASAIGYAIPKTESHELDWSMAPLGVSLLCWIYSFYCGCKFLEKSMSVIYTNFYMYDVDAGRVKEIPNSPIEKNAVLNILKSRIDEINKKGSKFYKRQAWFILYGVVAYVTWAVLNLVAKGSIETV
jgi:hypothetical protein